MGITTSLRNRATWQITATLQAPGLIKSNLLQKMLYFFDAPDISKFCICHPAAQDHKYILREKDTLPTNFK